MKRISGIKVMAVVLAVCIIMAGYAQADDKWVVYQPKGKPAGKHIVFVTGDEEYRSEEALPQLGKILAVQRNTPATGRVEGADQVTEGRLA